MFSTAIQSFLNQHHYPALNIKAVFFDMDGVLFDTMPAHAKAWVIAMNGAGLHFTEYQGYLNEGRTGASTIDNEFVKVFGRHSTEEEKQHIYKQKSQHFLSFGESMPIPYTYELTKKIKAENIDRLVVTGSGEKTLLERVEQFYPGIFNRQRMVTAYDVKHGKPNPEPYLMALQKANVKPWEAVVIENAPLGVQAGVAAGIFTIAVNTGILEDEVLHQAGANLVFGNMKDLHDHWDLIRSNYQNFKL
jgi:HAD superfamily hydrolase (TIGR01509 family)